MALLTMMKYGRYQNKDAVENVLRYIMRVRKYEDRANELLAYGGAGVPLYATPELMIQKFLYVQKLFHIDSRKGRRMHHEVLNLRDEEYEKLGSSIQNLYQYALNCCMVYFEQGHQVVFAIHWERCKRLHIHFAVNTINFITGKKWHTSMNEVADRERIFRHLLNVHIKVVEEDRMGGMKK